MLEVIAKVILRCFDKNTVEDLYLAHLLHFNEADVRLWKRVKADWALALREALPKSLDKCSPTRLESLHFIRDLPWNNMVKKIEAILDSVSRFWNQKILKRSFFSVWRNLFFTNVPEVSK